MTTAAAHAPTSVSSLPGRRYDRVFFSGMAGIVLLSVIIGFGPTYYLAGVFRAPLPAPIIHVHAAVFSCWILLLAVQTTLVAGHRVDLHRKLGVFGFGLACLMPIVGVLAATNRLVRNMAPPGMDAKTFYAIPVGDMLIFPVLIGFAYQARRDSPQHKRLIFIGTFSLLTAAFARFHVSFLRGQPIHAMMVPYGLLVVMAAYDLWSTRKIHRATAFGGAFLIVAQLVRVPIAHSAAWQSFATWVQTHSSWIA
jgi:FtsH-binding integral membrane protein